MEMFRKSTAIVLLLVVFASNGWHLMAIQTYAWAGMFSNFSKVYSFSDSLDMTFSGKKLCENCHIVSELQEKKESG